MGVDSGARWWALPRVVACLVTPSPAIAPWVEYLKRLPLVDREVLMRDLTVVLGIRIRL